jgi:hypothetical protein
VDITLGGPSTDEGSGAVEGADALTGAGAPAAATLDGAGADAVSAAAAAFFLLRGGICSAHKKARVIF